MGINITKADRAIDELIEKRARERDEAKAAAAAEREQVNTYLRHRNGGYLQEWADYYRMQIRVAEQMRERALSRLGKLLDLAAGRARRP